MLIGPSKNIANNGKGMYVGLKQPLGDGERCVTPARAAAKETNFPGNLSHIGPETEGLYCFNCTTRHFERKLAKTGTVIR